jgi:cytochrome c
MNNLRTVVLISFGMMILVAPASAVDGDATRGQQLFGACAACHSLEPNRSMTGPSLADLWKRKAGSLSSFPRYSSALKSADFTWDDRTLNEWLKDPQHFIPGNTMTFQGIPSAQQRADLLAFLKVATQPGRSPPSTAQREGQMGGMMGMMGGNAVPNLKKIDPEDRVQAINHCGDTYKVTTSDGKTRDFWERNLRFKTDMSDDGPQNGAPAIVGAGMVGDRADVIFSAPEEISSFIHHEC